MSAELWLGKRKPVDTAGAVLAKTCGKDTRGELHKCDGEGAGGEGVALAAPLESTVYV